MPDARHRAKNLIFWGAGATARLGISVTKQQAKFVATLAGDSPARLDGRVSKALAGQLNSRWHRALHDLITVLGDDPENEERIDHFSSAQLDAMRRNWPRKPDADDLRCRMIELRMEYDWPALKAAVRLCPAYKTENFEINDLLNILDLHIAPGLGLRSAPARGDDFRKFLGAARLVGARRALTVILLALFHIEYHSALANNAELLRRYLDFAKLIAIRARRGALAAAASGARLDAPQFFRSETAFVSLNYDPIALWTQFLANRKLNQLSPPHLGSPAIPLHVFHDFGHLIPARRIGKRESDWPWYPLNEGAAERLNEQEHPNGYRVVLTKFLFPHGCLCWRQCPDCGKLSTFHGDSWQLDSPSLFPPPPLLAFDDQPIPDWIKDSEREARQRGEVDARACLHCGTLTYAGDTQIRMQSSFKTRPPSFIEEVERDLGATAMGAEHFIFMGYSLPPDDVEFRAFFAARQQRKPQPRCTVITRDPANDRWLGPSELIRASLSADAKKTVTAAQDIFGTENVRYFGGGAPAAFLGPSGDATASAVEKLLRWDTSA